MAGTTITVNGVGLYAELRGDGDPLVLVHGGWTDSYSWQLVAPALAETFTVLTYDRRGHSRSERPVGQGCRRQDEDDLVALIGALDLAPVHLVGNSYGGSIALSVAQRHPDLVRTVAAHEPPLLAVLDEAPGQRRTADAVREQVTSIADQLRTGDVEAGTKRFMEEVALGPGSWEQLIPEEARRTYIHNAPMFVDIAGDPAWASFEPAPFAVPALVSRGDQTAPWMPAIVLELAHRIPGVQEHLFRGAGHAPHLTHPEDFLATTRGFASQQVVG